MTFRKTFTPAIALCIALATLAGCTSDADIARVMLEADTSTTRVNVAPDYIEVRTIALPLYAKAEQIPVLAADGSVRVTDKQVWADAPDAALTSMLASNLAQITSATVAAEPWPLEQYPDARIEVRVDQLIASLGGVLKFNGTYFVTSVSGNARERAERFAFEVPVAGEDYIALSRANAQAVRLLSEAIAKRMGR